MRKQGRCAATLGTIDQFITGRIANMCRRLISPLSLCLSLCLALAGCASAVDGPLLFGDAGKYQFHDCEQLATAARNQIKREQELKELITRAESGAGGIFVSLLAYKSDYVAVEEDIRIIETTARSKKCPTLNTWQSNSAIR
jgi:hypothetical protein